MPVYLFFHLATPIKASPERLTTEVLRDIPRTIGSGGTAKLRFGVAYTFNILDQRTEQVTSALQALLKSSQESDVPVFICLDGQNWWTSRPEFWNWWDPEIPGYNVANRANVEWTGWGPEFAVKIGWRNWGRQMRVAPAPNLASPAFLAEHDRAFKILIPMIVKWYTALPADRKYLFGGLKVGWEASVNVNAFYYHDGNAIFERTPKDPSGDPNDHKSENGWTFGQAPLGYAAVFTSGLKKTGDLTKEDLEIVVHNYLLRLSKAAYELGIPKHLIFTHQGGTYAPWDKHLGFSPAINEYSIPGWSFYSHDPSDCGSLAHDMQRAGRTEWAAVEWLRSGSDAAQWKRNLERSLSFKEENARLISIYNWESFRKAPGAIEAVRELKKQRMYAGETMLKFEWRGGLSARFCCVPALPRRPRSRAPINTSGWRCRSTRTARWNMLSR